MKIRNGFVSNSSSSSFVMLGAYFDYEQYNVIAEKFDDNYLWSNVDDTRYRDKKVIVKQDDSSFETWIGFDIHTLKDNETIGQIKHQVKDMIKSKLGIDVPIEKIDFYNEEIYS